MTDLRRTAEDVQRLLHSNLPPVGIAFRDRAPDGVPHVSSAAPASCSYWKRAADGEVFWTGAEDHQNCPIGAHTHGVQMQPEKQRELEGMIGTMVQLGYVSMSEVPQIPHRTEPLRVAVYAPLSKMPCDADVVLVRGTAAQLMLVAEAAQSAGVPFGSPAMGRPTCAAIPQALEDGKPSLSLACIGNRVYTGLTDGEGYVAVPAAVLPRIAEKLQTISHANAELEKFHRARAGA